MGDERSTRANAPPTVFIGTSGWTYAEWNGSFYPRGLPPRDRLEYFAERFPTVELNASFYRWPADAQFASWCERVPDGFVFSVKAPRTLTHHGRLDDRDEVVDRIASGIRALGTAAGPLLLQFPPDLQVDLDGLAHVLRALPSDLRVAVEFRHASWETDEVRALLRERGVALVQVDALTLDDLTTDFAYVRLHGTNPRRRYSGSYTDEQLGRLAEAAVELRARGGSAYLYFDNTADRSALRDAEALQGLVREPG